MEDVSKKYGPMTLGLFAIVLTGAWAFASGTLAIGLFSGGLPVLIYSTLLLGLATSVLAMCLAEFSSAHPHQAGCSLIATKVAGPRWGRLAGYFTGGFHTFGVICTPAANTLVTCQLVATLGTILHPQWIPARWQIFLVFQALNIMTALAIKFGFRFMNWITNTAIIFLIVTYFVLIGFFAANSTGAASDEFVWSKFVNETGWSGPICTFIGMSNILYIYGPPHWLLNMAEDARNPRRSIPIAISIQQVGNIVILFGFYVAAGYAVTDWDALLTTTYPAPTGALIQQALNSKGSAFVLLLCVVLPTFAGNMSYTSANLRLVHGFAETGALPKRTWLMKMDKHNEVPINLLYLVSFISFLWSCVYLGSSVGFTIILSSANLLYAAGYVPIFLGYLATGGQHLGKQGYFRLPKAVSLAASTFTLLYLCLVIVIYSLPPVYPVTAATMNYSSIVGIVVGIFLALMWSLYADKKYIGYPEVVDQVVLGEYQRDEPILKATERVAKSLEGDTQTNKGTESRLITNELTFECSRLSDRKCM